MKKKMITLGAVFFAGAAVLISNAAVLGEYTFNDTGTGTVAQRMSVAMGATSVATGMSLSQLGTNTTTTLEFGGFAAGIPNPATDAFSFFGNSGNFYLGMRRADSGVSSAFAQSSDTSAAVQPLGFVIYADSTHSVTVSNLVISSLAITTFAFQEAGAPIGTTVTTANPLGDDIVSLNEPVVIPAGTSKEFTLYMSSGAFSSAHWLDNIAIHGSVEAGTVPVLGEYTFNDVGAEGEGFAVRMAKAMGASGEISGVSLSQLGTNTTTALEFGGFAAGIPNPTTDAFSFFGNSGNFYLGMRRADFGVPSAFAQSSDTSAAVQPLNFTVTADATHDVNVSSILINSLGVTVWAVQEAGKVVGPSVTTANSLGDDLIYLTRPVTISSGTSKAFTIFMKSGAFSSGHWVNNIQVLGAVERVDGGEEPPAAATVVGVSSVSGSVVRLVVHAPDDAARYYPVYEPALEADTGWTNRIAHSDNSGGPFNAITNLSHSAIEGSNVVIYLEADVAKRFFRVQGD